MNSKCAVQNDFTLEVHLHIRQVAQFQSRITEIVAPLATLDADLKSKAAFPHLQRLNQLPFAYGSSVIEVVRRKDFNAALNDWLARLQAALNEFAGAETSRRTKLRDNVLSQLPLQIPALEESVQVAIELSMADGGEALSKMALGQKDVDGE